MMRQAKLGNFLAKRSRGIVPASTPDETFELYSVPAFPTKTPEVVTGAEIGSNKQIVEPGTVLLCKINPRINRAWTVGSFTKHQKIASTEWITFPPHPDVEPRYLAHYLSRKEIRDYLAANASGVGGSLMRVKAATVEDLPLPLPNVDEQRRIVAEIEKQFSRLEEAVANLKRVKANLKRYKAAVLSDAVEGELAGDTTRWTPVRLGEVASSVRNGISIKPVGESGTRILRISAVRPMALDLDDVRYLAQPPDECESFLLAAGDVLFTRYNGSVDLVGVCAAVPELQERTVYPDKLIRVRVPSEALLPSFLVIAVSTGEARAFIGSRVRTTAGQAGVSGADIKAIPLRVPPLEEQHHIVAEVDRRLSIVREVEAEVDANLKRALALWQAVLTSNLSGEPRS